ncbi:MAG: AAA family ATPase [Candidatus Omnitrophica bacterium]|nr:AAA family ATPase [Candidatus Omnitrophota bacterium]MBU4478933.1 AAA family ATPase [Candidatus Omnitrophota bacterium]MCG2704391.1 AAA family ATPase [Candidatus Omnitrophota bacterium]
MSKTKRVFIAATQQNDGKTTVSLGLIYCLKKMFARVGFIKPVGQRYLIEEGYKVDEDSILIEHVCQMKCLLKDMSPIAVERGFTEKYINNPKKAALVKEIKKSFECIAKVNDLVVIEGTGHAGVGSVFDLSNAYVAKQLDAKVILISSGGVGKPIDEILLNKALFDKEGVEIIGVIVNKVLPEKYAKVDELVRKGFKRKGLAVLGVVPYEPVLSKPMMSQIQEELRAEIVYGATYLDNAVEKIVIGAMEPHDALNYIDDKSLVITPGDREDIILTAISMHLIYGDNGPSVAGLVLTGGISPHPSVLNLIKCTDIPVLLVKEDTYNVASRVHDLTIKIRPQDRTKTNLVIDMINKYVDIDAIVKNL